MAAAPTKSQRTFGAGQRSTGGSFAAASNAGGKTVTLLPNVAMSQSAVLVGALFAAFLIYLMLKGRLGTYWALMTGGTATASAGTGGVIAPSGIANQAAGSIGTAGTPAVVGQPGSPAFVPTPNTITNFLTGHWWQPAGSTSQGTLTPYGSSQAGGGIGMM
jgi:hypothetical protein